MRYDYVDDISKGNERLFLTGSQPGLSALICTIDSDRGADLMRARQEALRSLIELGAAFNRTVWLVAGHSYPQPDTRVVNYYRLWGGLARAGINFSQAGQDDIKESSPEGVRYFGFRRIDPVDIVPTEAVLRGTQSFIVLATDDDDLHAMLNGGWKSVGVGVPPEALERSLTKKIPVALVLGEFDDPAAEGVLITARETLRGFQKILSYKGEA